LIEGVSFKVAGADATHSLLPSSLCVSRSVGHDLVLCTGLMLRLLLSGQRSTQGNINPHVIRLLCCVKIVAWRL